jgi:hypothetical protein
MLSLVFRALFIKAAQPFVASALARDASANVKNSQ